MTSVQHVVSEGDRESKNDIEEHVDKEATTLPPATTPRAIRLIQNKRKSAALPYKEAKVQEGESKTGSERSHKEQA